ncbi:PHB depolymerase family esterase [Sphingomonas ginsenosidivorax]|uniref:PHB depolymerase family esterase n=2 Tax=Sphingomonas ginsenosidivorax TaxID=862135 RepID=A0A5C6UJ43_9SPHN|nr:PHB depolymerase family esterase [Sphingomonas ginsenosidivorax]
MEAFGRNPGELRALIHVPAGLPSGAPLVVVLHGCTQSAGAYDQGSGWSALADRFGFAVLYPEQQRGNNPNLCFNWFFPADTRRGGGEAESIREMVVAAVERHRLDAARVFVTGLSAGGAMTSVMLATHPEMFAAGAIIAGLPYGTANTIPEALERMRGQGHDRAGLRDRVRAASAHGGPWPAVSVWHGTADRTVNATNAALIVEQWRGIHGVETPPVTERVDGQVHRKWHDKAGRPVVEEYAVSGLGHGTPIATSGDEAYGVPGPHMLEAGISSTYRIAASWGIVPAMAPTRARSSTEAPVPAAPRQTRAAARSFDPGRVIEDALRAAGLRKP